MPRYMLLLHADEKVGLALPKAVMDPWMEKMGAYKDALDKAGALGCPVVFNPYWMHHVQGFLQTAAPLLTDGATVSHARTMRNKQKKVLQEKGKEK